MIHEEPYMFWDAMERITGNTKQYLQTLVRPYYPSGHKEAFYILIDTLSKSPELGRSHYAYSLASFLMTIFWNELHMEYTLVPDTRPIFNDEIGITLSKN